MPTKVRVILKLGSSRFQGKQALNYAEKYARDYAPYHATRETERLKQVADRWTAALPGIERDYGASVFMIFREPRHTRPKLSRYVAKLKELNYRKPLARRAAGARFRFTPAPARAHRRPGQVIPPAAPQQPLRDWAAEFIHDRGI